MYWAYPPSTWKPLNFACGHRFSSPRRQNSHSPQAEYNQGTPTRWPVFKVGATLAGFAMPFDISERAALTDSPILSTTPTTWCPGMSGRVGGWISPSTVCKSVWHTPHTETLMRTCPGPGRGVGTLSLCSGLRSAGAGVCKRKAFIVLLYAKRTAGDSVFESD